MTTRPSESVSPWFRRMLVGLLVFGSFVGWIAGAHPSEHGFLLFFFPLVLGASFFGRSFALPAASVAFISQGHDVMTGAALLGVLVIIGERTWMLRRRIGRFAHRSFTDRLTGLFNYDFLQAQVRFEVDRVRRYGGSCSLIVVDLDHFKRFNDTHGHQAGNLLLRAIADTIQSEKRDSDFAARFGGEEFVVLVPGESTDAMRLAERLRDAVSEVELPALGRSGRVTISLGIASFPEQSDNASELFERADQALYCAKESGRNQTIVYPNVQLRRKMSPLNEVESLRVDPRASVNTVSQTTRSV